MICYAHRNEDRLESLIEHHSNALKVFNMYDKEYDIVKKVKTLLQELRLNKIQKGIETELSSEEIVFIINSFRDIISYHDIGKVNPKFQKDKMGQNIHKGCPTGIKIENVENMDSRHSMVSAAIYLNDKLKEIEDNNFKEKLFIKYIIILFTNIILNHHSYLKDFKKSSFEEMIDFVNSNDYLCFLETKKDYTLTKDSLTFIDKVNRLIKYDSMAIYILNKIAWSMLITCDFISTYNFFKSNETISINNIKDKDFLINSFEKTDIVKGINEYSINKNYFKENKLPLINELRSSITLECIDSINKNVDKYNVFNLESPTGSGKTYTSFAIVTEILKNTKEYSNLIYAFPANSISAQASSIIKSIYGENLIQEINSITPIKKLKDNDENINYNRTLLERQLLNYPIISTSNIKLFDLFFGVSREAALGFTKLFNSIVILDEIQNYKNDIWVEMTEFINKYSKILNIKVIIMSATLPNLENLLDVSENRFFNLIENPRNYYEHPLFKDRVEIDSTLLNKSNISFNNIFEKMMNEIKNRNEKLNTKSKFLIEFIKKQTAKDFHSFLVAKLNKEKYDIYEIDGDTSALMKEWVINKCKDNNPDKDILLVTTQVIECGVDIDMDLGAKDSSFPDYDEQFIGRVNRSCAKTMSRVFLFNYDDEKYIYRNDNRIGTNVSDNKFLQGLLNKDFKMIYNYVLTKLYKAKNKGLCPVINGFREMLNNQSYVQVEKHMKLIDNDKIEIFLPYIYSFDGKSYDGFKLWNKYRTIYKDETLGYSKKRVLLQDLKKSLNMFTYSIYVNKNFCLENPTSIEGLYYIEDGEKYIENGIFNLELFKEVYT